MQESVDISTTDLTSQGEQQWIITGRDDSGAEYSALARDDKTQGLIVAPPVDEDGQPAPEALAQVMRDRFDQHVSGGEVD